MPPGLLSLKSVREVLKWYETNLCGAELRDPRGFRVRFKPENFVHLVQLKNKHGEEPRNPRLALEEIRAGKIQFVTGRFDPQRAAELSWAATIATNPDHICGNWQVLGDGDETYVKDFGAPGEPRFRVLVCKVIGQTRHIVTIFPRERIAGKEILERLWP